jgi:aryl-alcohol dehydrogenase-like predicted oxidoreductase
MTDLPLVLGGHTFIEELGNDPPLSPEEERAIVEACLDAGITWFDTTFTDERESLGRALEALDRHDEATIMAWNFFGQVYSNPIPYKPGHLDAILPELRTNHVDRLVVHPPREEDEPAHRRGVSIAQGWQEAGRVGKLGIWHPGPDAEEKFGRENPYDFMAQPYNVDTEDAPESFAAAKRLGWETIALSPFVRGWKLDAMVEAAEPLEDEDASIRGRLADHMLRYSLFQPDVDRLVVGMRRVEWVHNNVDSVKKGPISPEEQSWLTAIAERAREE